MAMQPLTTDTPCPGCGELSLDSLDSDWDGNDYVSEWSCGNCDAQFDQVYEFVKWYRLGD